MLVLVTGIAGAIGRLLTLELLEVGIGVCGLDRRDFDDAPAGVRVYQGDLHGAAAHEVFCVERPDVVVHLAAALPLSSTGTAQPRKNLSLTRELLDTVARHGIEGLVFVSRHLYYGAAADLPTYHREQDPPHGVETYPEAADLVAADLMVGAALWSMPRTRTTVLRVCHPLGPSPRGILAQLLSGARVPTVLGFDPLVQFLHAADIARAIRMTIEQGLRGIYNVGSARPLPLSQMIAALGRSNVAIPEAWFRLSAGRFGLSEVPPGALSLLKYPIVVDDAAFRNRTGYLPRFSELETLELYKAATGVASE
jgi:UDP-glucose 4-epimerase